MQMSDKLVVREEMLKRIICYILTIKHTTEPLQIHWTTVRNILLNIIKYSCDDVLYFSKSIHRIKRQQVLGLGKSAALFKSIISSFSDLFITFELVQPSPQALVKAAKTVGFKTSDIPRVLESCIMKALDTYRNSAKPCG